MPLKKTRAKTQTSIEPSDSPALLLRFHRTWQDLEKLEARLAKKMVDLPRNGGWPV